MELNFKDRFAHCYDSQGAEKYFIKGNKVDLKCDDHSSVNERLTKRFHLDCKYTRKKVCTCKYYENLGPISIENEKQFSNFLLSLVNDEVDLSTDSGNKIQFVKKNKHEKLNEERSKIDEERLRHLDYNKVKFYVKNNEEVNLSYAEYREIERSINEDKKICENCKTNIYENNYHKGWKNEAGEYVLLCPMCSKKYFNGALEIKFDSYSRKDEFINRSSQSVSQFNSNNQIVIKNDGPVTAPTKINFQVINTSRPVEDPTLLGNKRGTERDSDLTCSNKRCNKVGKKNDFLNCGKCERYFHPYCVDPQVVLKYANRFKWHCNNCRACLNCNKPDVNLLRCCVCDRSFHAACHNYTEFPSNRKIYCTDCINCKNCNKQLNVLTALNQQDLMSIKGYRVCDECWKYYKNKHYCPKCLKIDKQGDNLLTKIYCRKCLNSYHAQCEGLSQEEVKELNKTKYDYTCNMCKLS